MEDKSVTLKACPLCARHAFVHFYEPGYVVWCSTDRCLKLPARETEAEAIAAWNHRSEAQATGLREPWPGCYADLQRRRVTTLATLGLMLSKMAGGEAAEVVGFDAAKLYAEVLMALAIEDVDDTDIALELAREHPDGDMLVGAFPPPDGVIENKAGGLWYRRWFDAQARVNELERLLANPPKHKFWGAGEPDCPRDIKAGNGELHTLRCKVCGQDNPRGETCLAALEGAERHG